MSLLLTAYALGAAVTSLASADYLASADVLGYVLRGVVLSLDPAFSHLPGVFTHNPHRDTVNVSLWTLPVEVRMYIELLAFWLATRLAGPQKKRAAFGVVISLAFAYCAPSRHRATGCRSCFSPVPRRPCSQTALPSQLHSAW